jgi:hypothetical protein
MSARTGRPVDERTQSWVESSLRSFLDQFGPRQLHAEVAVPTARFVPAGYAATADQIEELVSAACVRMEADRDQIDVRVCDGPGEDVARHSRLEGRRAAVSVGLGEAADPVVLLAIIAHALSHVRLSGEQRIPAQRPGQERLADLLTVFCGYGVFSTNGAMRSDRLDAAVNAGCRGLGYLKPDEFGYALSCYAWLREERNPAWARFVSAGSLQVMRRGLEFLAGVSRPGELPAQQQATNQNATAGPATISVVKTRSATTSFGVAIGGITLPGTSLRQRPPGPRESGSG